MNSIPIENVGNRFPKMVLNKDDNHLFLVWNNYTEAPVTTGMYPFQTISINTCKAQQEPLELRAQLQLLELLVQQAQLEQLVSLLSCVVEHNLQEQLAQPVLLEQPVFNNQIFIS